MSRKANSQEATAASGNRRAGTRSLVSRFAASTAILAAAVVVLAVASFLLTDGPFHEGSVSAKLQGYSLTMAEHIWNDPQLAQVAAKRHHLRIVVTLPDKRLAFGADGLPIDPEESFNAGVRYRRVAIHRHDGSSIVFYWDMMNYAHEHVLAVVGLVLLLLVTIGITYAFQVAQLRPLQKLHAGVEAVSKGDFTTPVPVVRQDEIGQVAQAFNTMTSRVRQMIDGRERLLADVSHELRSPLARMKVALELMPESDKRTSIVEDVRQMESLTTVLLERERLRMQTEQPYTDSVSIGDLVREVVAEYSEASPTVHVTLPDNACNLQGDAALLRVLLQNLIDNALKYSLPDSNRVEVELTCAPGAIELEVRDDGRGVPADEVERVFEPFVKLDPARGHGSGYGLGLNLCQRIVASHGGAIRLTSRNPRGTSVLVHFPAP
jgi:signal transduction histidine kinase